MFGVKGKPWEGAGAVNVEDCQTAREVITKSKLNFTVAKCEVVAKMPIKDFSDEALDRFKEIENGALIYGNNVYREVPNSFATYRTDYNIPLGNVKSKYTVVQNIDAFNFFDKAIGRDKAIWQTAGAFGNGERIFVSAKLPDNILVNGSDPIETYLLFTNTHDGSSGVKILFTPIRVICQNTLNAAIRGASNIVTFRHTQSVHQKLDVADEILGISHKLAENFRTECERLTVVKMTDKGVMKYICQQYMTEQELLKAAQLKIDYNMIMGRNWMAVKELGLSSRKLNMITDTWEYYHTGPGQKQYLGTAWGAANAVSGYLSNVDTSVSDNKRFDSLVYGDKAKKIQKAFDAEFIYC